MSAEVVWGDDYGEVIDRPEDGYIEIRWFDTTAGLTSDEFNSWLARFAGSVEERGRSGVLVDSVQFAMDMALMDGPWRDENIIPRYNQAGVTKFAFLMPTGMPLIGSPPTAEGPGTFPTGYFGSRVEAVAWLAGT